jgi:protoporphyrinogen oxidase
MNEKPSLVIVGGGLAGILLSLKLSSNSSQKYRELILIEEQPSLGGRLFFSPPGFTLKPNREETHQQLWLHAQEQTHLSGFGLEAYDLHSKESLLRHIENALTQHEKTALENHIAQFEESSQYQQKNRLFFVKKNWTNFSELTGGSSEMCTKKEAEFLSLILTSSRAEESVLTKAWQELSKPARESLSQLISCCIGNNWESMTILEWAERLSQFFKSNQDYPFLAFQRKVGLEFFLEDVLRKRGVCVKTRCQVLRVEHMANKQFLISLRDEVQPDHKTLTTENLVFAIPLAKTRGLLPKEIYAPEQSKFVSRIAPQSLVVYEIAHFSQVQSEESKLTAAVFDKLIFPVEQAQGVITEDDRVLLYTSLDFEDSMQAPAVREAVARLKRAASRILGEAYLSELKKGFRMSQSILFDKVVLLPVAKIMADGQKCAWEIKQVKMGVPHLYCCGDSLFSLGDAPWSRITHSVHNLAELLN